MSWMTHISLDYDKREWGLKKEYNILTSACVDW